MRKAPIIISVAAAVAAALGGGLAWQSAGTSSLPQEGTEPKTMAEPTASGVAIAPEDSTAPAAPPIAAPQSSTPAAQPIAVPVAPPAPPTASTPQPAPAPSIILQLARQAQTEAATPYRPGTAVIPRAASDDPDFGPFLQRLRQAVAQRDREFLLAIADENIQLSFGRSQPLADRMAESDGVFWQQLERALTPGCAPNGILDEGGDEREYWSCPTAFLAETRAPDLDFYNQLIVDGTDVAVRQQPSLDSPILARVSNTVLRQEYLSASESLDDAALAALRRWYERSETLSGWQYVSLPDGRRGFISSRYAYASLGYRALFERNGQGSWTMTAFIAGD